MRPAPPQELGDTIAIAGHRRPRRRSAGEPVGTHVSKRPNSRGRSRTRGHEAVSASHARASTNAGLDPHVATHPLVAKSRHVIGPRRGACLGRRASASVDGRHALATAGPSGSPRCPVTSDSFVDRSGRGARSEVSADLAVDLTSPGVGARPSSPAMPCPPATVCTTPRLWGFRGRPALAVRSFPIGNTGVADSSRVARNQRPRRAPDSLNPLQLSLSPPSCLPLQLAVAA